MSSPLLTLPCDVINTVQLAMPAALYKLLLSQCTAVTLLNGGLSNQNYLLSCIEGNKVLRVNQLHSNWCDRDLEVECWHFAIKGNVAPKLEWVSDDKQLYLSEYIPQYHGDWSILSFMCGHLSARPSAIMATPAVDVALQLEQLLSSLSTLTLPSKSISVSAQWQQYARQLDSLRLTQTRPEWHLAWQQLQQKNVQIKHWLTQLESCLLQPIFCHRDLTPYNLLLSGESTSKPEQTRLVCIDYEYAIASHPLFDLASVIATHHLTAAQVDQLTHKMIVQYCCIASLTDFAAAKAALPAAINCFWLFSAMWALLMAAKEPESSTQSMTKYINYYNEYIALTN
ncbi:phosphotransferase [Shewanella sp. A14]